MLTPSPPWSRRALASTRPPPTPDSSHMAAPPPLTDRLAQWRDDLARVETLTPCFIVGPMKTGTTWLVRSIGEHPQIAASFETHAAEVLLPRVRDAFAHYHGKLDEWFPGPHTGLTTDDELFLQRTIVDRMLVRFAKGSGKWDRADLRVVADKTPMHAFNIDELAAMYPSARFILCTRDVRDAAVSAWKHLHELAGHRKNSTFEEYARHYAEHLWVKPIAAARKSFAALTPERWKIVSYEAHKADPASVLAECFAFLGVDGGHEISLRIAEASDFRAMTGRRAGEEVREFYRKGIAGDWVNHMTPEFGEVLLAIAAQAEPTENEPPLSRNEGSSEFSCEIARR